MRKGLFFWFSISVAAAIIGGTAYFLGRSPDKVGDVARAIPVINMESPRIYILAQKRQVEPGFPEKLAGNLDENAKPYFRAVDDLLPLFSFAEESAALVAWESNEILFFGSFMVPSDVARDIGAGKLPDLWMQHSTGLALGPSSREGFQQLSAGNGLITLTLLAEDNLLLVSSSLEGVERMYAVMKGEEKYFDPGLGLETSWPAHVRIFDGGLIAQAASLRGAKVPDTPIDTEIAWKVSGDSGDIVWALSGAREWIPEEVLSSLRPLEWKDKILLPDPLIMAAGLSVPEGLKGLGSESLEIPEWMKDAGMNKDSLKELLSGSLLFTVGGQSRVFLFSLPGFLVQLPGRGDSGKKWVDGFWNTKWGGFGVSPKPIEGFSHGGMINIPVTAVAAASEELAIAGVISSSSLGSFSSPAGSVLPPDGKALMWFYADFPRAADALEQLARVGGLAGKLGIDGGENVEEILKAARELRSLGEVTLIFNDPESGRGSWKGASPLK
ncbi:MAG TPA: hypothetical protein ENN89_00665 [Synergistetes bacterium]|nr:hypothetical protein [Synergistota bacterium]